MLNDSEKKKYKIINKVINGEITRKKAMAELNLSRQQIYRLIKIYKSKGQEGFIHGNRGKESKNKINEKIIEELEDLYLTDFYDFNFEQFYEKKYLTTIIYLMMQCLNDLLMMILFLHMLIKKQ